MEKESSLKLEDVLPIRFGFLKALPMYLWLFAVVVAWVLLLRLPHNPLNIGVITTLILGTMVASLVAYFVVYGLIGGLIFHPDTVAFGGLYIKHNIWGYNVWVFQSKDKKMQCVVLPRSVSITDFLCYNFSGQASEGYVLRYSTGGWFRKGAEFWFIENHVPMPREISIRRVGRAGDYHTHQKLRLCDRQGAVIYWKVSDLFEHVSVRGSVIDFAVELIWLLNRYVETDAKHLRAVK